MDTVIKSLKVRLINFCFLVVPSFPTYFMRRLQPRFEFGMQTVLPSVVNAVAEAGNSAVGAAKVLRAIIETFLLYISLLSF